MTFTVVINTFNYGRLLAKAIESVLAQEWPRDDFEIVVVDDGSTDDTPNVAASFANAIIYRRQHNQGQAAALNNGVSLSRGNIICLLDADDIFYPNKLPTVHQLMTSTGSNVVYNRYDLVDLSGRVLSPCLPVDLDVRHLAERAKFRRAGGVPTSSISASREILSELPVPPHFSICADSYLLSALALCGRVSTTSIALTGYRFHGGNAFLALPGDERKAMLEKLGPVIAAHLSSCLGIQMYDELDGVRTSIQQRHILKAISLTIKGQREIWRSALPNALKAKESAKLLFALFGNTV